MKPLYLFATLLLLGGACTSSRKGSREARSPFSVIAYYAGDGKDLDQYRFQQVDQVIYSFCHLREGALTIDDAADTLTIQKLAGLKSTFPGLKVYLSLGGWGGCAPCSEAFASEEGRLRFARSVHGLLRDFQVDGIDLDWEYPGIEGYPGHQYSRADQANFTALVRTLRKELGWQYGISFAAGGFDAFFDHSVEWEKVMPLVDRVNLMTYDLVNGFSTVTGHHTPLYSSPQQVLSVDHAVRALEKIGVPRRKMVIGAAFYARVWEKVPAANQGCFQTGKFKSFVPYQQFQQTITVAEGFQFFRDSIAHAPYAYHPGRQEFATFDDHTSVSEKTRYAQSQGLGGIMFWQLKGDTREHGLLEAIEQARKR